MRLLTPRQRFWFLISDIRLFAAKILTAYYQVRTVRIERRIKELETLLVIKKMEREKS